MGENEGTCSLAVSSPPRKPDGGPTYARLAIHRLLRRRFSVVNTAEAYSTDVLGIFSVT